MTALAHAWPPSFPLPLSYPEELCRGQGNGGLAAQLPTEMETSPTSACQAATEPPKIAAALSIPVTRPGHWEGVRPPGGQDRARKSLLLPRNILCKCHMFQGRCCPHEVGEQLSGVPSQARSGLGRGRSCVEPGLCNKGIVPRPAGCVPACRRGAEFIPIPRLFPADGILDVSPCCLAPNLGDSGAGVGAGALRANPSCAFYKPRGLGKECSLSSSSNYSPHPITRGT